MAAPSWCSALGCIESGICMELRLAGGLCIELCFLRLFLYCCLGERKKKSSVSCLLSLVSCLLSLVITVVSSSASGDCLAWIEDDLSLLAQEHIPENTASHTQESTMTVLAQPDMQKTQGYHYWNGV